MCGGGDVLDPSRRQRDEEQHVDPLEKDVWSALIRFCPLNARRPEVRLP
jgi:hypothetical protein